MARVCQVTGKKRSTGHNVSYSQRKTLRAFMPNLTFKKFWIPSEKRWIRLKVSTKALRIINKKGIESVLAKMKREGKKTDQ